MDTETPGYWLVWALPWPGGEVAEAVVAVAPGLTARDRLSADAVDVLTLADRYTEGRGARVIMFAELTRGLTRAGTSWAALGVDWESALAELEGGTVAYLKISERAYGLICNPSAAMAWSATGTADAGAYEVDTVRDMLTAELQDVWPLLIRAAAA
jgi:hypothetical protein